MKPVIQQESTGCAIASTAAIAGVSYNKVKKVANSLGIYASDKSLWSDTKYIRKLLSEFDLKTTNGVTNFNGWQLLPDCALLAIKWHLEKDKPYWHWVVFVREKGQEYVLDSKKGLNTNKRTDFGRMHPKWYIKVTF